MNIILSSICILFLSVSVVFAGPFTQGNYMENHQWGALESILDDWKTNKISTDECVIYGCYVLNAMEPSRNVNNARPGLLPHKYNLHSKSNEPGPYFFIHYIYENEEFLGPTALSEFKNTDWSDEEFVDNIAENPRVNESIQNVYKLPHSEFKREFNYRDDIFELFIHLNNDNIISDESIHIAALLEHFNIKRFYRKYSKIINKYNLENRSSHFTLLPNFAFKTKKTSNKKAVNIFNYYYELDNIIH